MVAASLIIAALLGAPFAPRAVVPVSSPTVAATVVPAAFNPQATARAHAASVSITPAVAGTMTTVVEGPTGVVVETLRTSVPVTAGVAVSYTWAATGAADGTYGIHVTLTDPQGAVTDTVVPVTVDTTAPVVAFGALRPALTKRGPVALRATTTDPSGAASIRVDVASQTDVAIGSTDVPVAVDGTSGTVDWNLRLRKRLLLPGVFKLRATVTDRAGNIGTSDVRLLRVDRPVTTRIIYSLPDAGNVIGLTFDDCGSNRDLQRIVSAFRAAKAQTTFFCNGVNVRDNVSADRSAVAGGNTIGSHTWLHPQMPTLPYGEQLSQIRGDVDIWWKVARSSPAPFFRPPYGLHNATTLQAAGDAGFAWTILWDVDPSDYLMPQPAALVQHVVTHARKGSIVVMHAN
ncbi:MAG: polysaccharide deacetylase family protein, partial [Gaiellales bacterium]